MSLPIITTSERTAFRKCPQKWQWRYRDGLAPHGEQPDALWFGIGIHEALAAWYLKGHERGPHPAQTFTDWCDDEIRTIAASYADRDRDEHDPVKYENAMELGADMLEAYIDRYGEDERWNVLDIERQFRVKVQNHGQAIARFWSTWDGVVRDEADGRIYLLEHKTASQISTAYLELDDQAGAYWAFAGPILRNAGILGPKEEIAGIIYNFLRKSKPDERPQNAGGAYLNKDGSVSKRQPPEPFVREVVERAPRERTTQLHRLADEVQWMNAIRSGDMPVIKHTSRDCTFCEFFIMCKSHERGGDNWKEIAKTGFEVTEPYDRYLKSAAA